MNAGSLPQGFRHLTLSSGLRAAAGRDPAKTALILGEARRTYGQVVANVNRTANMLLGLGLAAGEHAAIVSPNSMEYLEIAAGVSDIGAALATLNPKLTPGELADICNDAQARLLFVHRECEASIDPARLETVRRIIWLDSDYPALMAQASDAFSPPAIDEWATFAIPYTSGTTGKPKGVMLPHRSRTLGFLAYASEYGIYSPDDHFLAISPMCHGAGLAYAFASIFMGGTTEIMTRFEPEAVLEAIHAGAVTGVFTVPTHYHAMFGLEPATLERLRGNRLRGIVANAAPLSQPMKEQIVDYFGAGLLNETYGSTEAGVVTNLRPADQLRKTRCVGQPIMGTLLRLLDDEGREVAPGEVGELHSTSPYLFNGYWNKPDQTAEAFRDGFVSVGDMAVRDEEGFVYIVDRKKDMVITGGMNVYPREIETLLDQHAAVDECAVIGVEDPRWGEQLVAYVVAAPGASVSTEALAAYCVEHLAPYKRPKAFRPIDALPRNANGKVLKTALRDLHARDIEEVR
ncbi:class I adenylate-forming enzyme family protein [Phenylobacterium aquaticum]|uniref:class I adenylate-forming enzyme family protein n=1 Tax=Phenylobacterium aquaticum TaxID=1763816 RepID=UPI0026EAC91F|nr:AMP-binding protein [Phenylobacterium aquaticum]